jgi:FkbM family methyltransferase
MLIDLRELNKSYGLNIRGIIHVGGHIGQEIPVYSEIGIKNVVFFEPLKDVFFELEKNAKPHGYKCINTALGAKRQSGKINREFKNGGQSSSFMQPKRHLDYYPDITFDSVELAQIETLDSYNFNGKYNLLMADVQGYELEVLKGAVKTLEKIDYLYLEVNREELYSGCPMFEQIESFVRPYGFELKEIFWTDRNWGDAFFVKTKIMHPFITDEFRPKMPFCYPVDNDQTFEEYFLATYSGEVTGRKYIPVNWTSYQINSDFGKDFKKIEKLQNVIDLLDRNEKYFTIVQYDDGILPYFGKLDCIVFSGSGMGAKGENVRKIDIPLACKPHNYEFNQPKDIFCSFIGRLETHPIRKFLFDKFNGRDGFHFETRVPLDRFCEIASRSVFMLAPRGYGITSFRLLEACQYQSIPVYVTDSFSIPFNETGYYVPVRSINYEIDQIPDKLQKIYSDKNVYLEYLRKGNKFFVESQYINLYNRIIYHLNNYEY